tara:strand:+ start:872 stop:1141 length:270 start_codon:yes stop_codon:yes gene_type:complete
MAWNCTTIRANGSTCYGQLNGCDGANRCYPCNTNNDGGPYQDCNGRRLMSDVRRNRGRRNRPKIDVFTRQGMGRGLSDSRMRAYKGFIG